MHDEGVIRRNRRRTVPSQPAPATTTLATGTAAGATRWEDFLLAVLQFWLTGWAFNLK